MNLTELIFFVLTFTHRAVFVVLSASILMIKCLVWKTKDGLTDLTSAALTSLAKRLGVYRSEIEVYSWQMQYDKTDDKKRDSTSAI